MPTLFLHALIAVLSLLQRGQRGARTPRRIIREIAYARAAMSWAQMCIEPVEVFEPITSRPSQSLTSA